jgi:hypothetical protein
VINHPKIVLCRRLKTLHMLAGFHRKGTGLKRDYTSL